MRIRGAAAAAVVVLSVASLAACGSSAGDVATSPVAVQTITVRPSFDVRPVLTERTAVQADCVAPTASPTRASSPGLCSFDKKVFYTLGPAVVTAEDVQAVAKGQQGDESGTFVANVALNDRGTKAFAELTDAANSKPTPANQVAYVVDGLVVSAPAVATGAITGGQIEVSLWDESHVDSFVGRWPASVQVSGAATPSAGAVTVAEARCEALVRAEPEMAALRDATGSVSQTFTISGASGAVEAEVIGKLFPGADRYTQFLQCSTQLTDATPTPGAPTCPPGEALLRVDKMWLVDQTGQAAQVLQKDAARLIAGNDGSPCS